MKKSFKCKICDKSYISINTLCDHIGEKHKSQIPEGWSPRRFEYYLRTGKSYGTCTECGEETKWNEATNKYHRICESPMCRESVRDTFKKRMIKAGRPINMCASDEHQRKMIYSKKTSGIYTWSIPDWFENDSSNKSVDIYFNKNGSINYPIITFPESRWNSVKKRLIDKKSVVKTVTGYNDDIRKYKIGYIYSTEWMSLVKILSIKEYKLLSEHPLPKTLTNDEIDQIKKIEKDGNIYEVIEVELNGTKYASSYELDFLKLLDVFLNFSPYDVMGPSPHTYSYTYDGKNKMYIPDFYILSLNLEVEIKQTTNTNPQMKEDRLKNEAKDKMMKSLKDINYIKIVDKNYEEFFKLLVKLKEKDDCYTPLSNKKDIIKEEYRASDSFEEILTFTQSLYQKNYPDTKYLPSMDEMGVIKTYEKQIKSINNKPDLYKIKKEIVSYRNDLITKHKINKNLKNEINYIDTHLISEINLKIRYMKDRSYKDNIMLIKNGAYYLPIYIFLGRLFTNTSNLIHAVINEPYTHAGLSLSTELKNIFSFNRKGFVIENIKEIVNTNKGDKSKYSIWVYFARFNEYLNIEKTLNEFMEQGEKFKYNFRGLLDNLTKKSSDYEYKKFCSEFVSEILKNANESIYKKASNLYTPSSLVNNNNFHFIKKGYIKNYNKEEVDKSLKDIISKEGFEIKK